MSAEYEEAVDYLYGFVNFEHRRIDQYAPENISLDRPRRLLQRLGNPQARFPAIHIAGTKGKGSVAAMCAACLRAAGLRVGLYTSPHLQDFRDRIRILSPADGDGRIPEAAVVAQVDALRQVVGDMPDLTWFEVVTALAFSYFAEQRVDAAVVEVGLGGRLDATNVLSPAVSVITSLSLDHTYLLGDTLAEIATEKGGIIKPGTPVVVSPQAPEAMSELAAIAGQRGAPLVAIGRDWDYAPAGSVAPSKPQANQWMVITKAPAGALVPAGTALELSLAGRYQQENAAVAVAALDQVRSLFPSLTSETVRRGLAQVVWPGRLQMLAYGQDGPALLVDCAHNVDSARKLADALTLDYRYQALCLVLGITADKDLRGILRTLLPLASRVIMTASGHPRAAAPEELQVLATELGFETLVSHSVSEAVQIAWSAGGPEDLICVTGSIFVVGDLLNHWESLQSTLKRGAISEPS